MSRRSRTLSILVLLIFLFSSWIPMLNTLHPELGIGDCQAKNYLNGKTLETQGDDDDDGANIEEHMLAIFIFLRMQLAWTNS